MNFQFPGHKSATLRITKRTALAFEAWKLELLWSLGFGIWIFSL